MTVVLRQMFFNGQDCLWQLKMSVVP